MVLFVDIWYVCPNFPFKLIFNVALTTSSMCINDLTDSPPPWSWNFLPEIQDKIAEWFYDIVLNDFEYILNLTLSVQPIDDSIDNSCLTKLLLKWKQLFY